MSGTPAAEHPVLLLLELLDHVGAARELVHHEGEGRGRGVVAGEHQGHQLVADLAVGKPSPASSRTSSSRLSTSHPPGIRALPAMRDLGEDDLVEDPPRGQRLAPRRPRPAQEAQREVDPVELERPLEMLGRGRAFARLVGVEPEQGAHRDPHRQPPHPLVDVDDLAAAQHLDRRRRLVDHRLDRGGDLLAMEGGHHRRPDVVVVVLVDRQQAVAEQRDQVAEARLAPVEVLRVGDRHVVVGLGPEHEDDFRVEQAQGEDRAELFVAAEQDRQRVAGDLERAGDRVAARARRVAPAPLSTRPRRRRRPGGSGSRTSAAVSPPGRRRRHAGRRNTLVRHLPHPSWLAGQTCSGGPRRSAARGGELAAGGVDVAPAGEAHRRGQTCSARIARKRSIRSGEEPS